jgi:DNA-binding transcriptional LysR family regulator
VPTKSLATQLVAAGLGLSVIPRAAALAHPGITILQPAGYRPASASFSLVTPSARTAAPKVRAFVEAMKAYVATRPDLFA